MCSVLLPFGKSMIGRVVLKTWTFQLQRATYKSSLSLDKIYPNSSQQLVTPPTPKITGEYTGYIPMEKLELTYSCSSGPGGQNVNKVHTKVDLRFKVSEANWLGIDLRDRLLKEHANKLTKEGYLVIKSDITRSQQLNVADCMRKLRDILRNANKPKPKISEETVEMLRRRFEKAARERLLVKRSNSANRAAHQAPTVNDL